MICGETRIKYIYMINVNRGRLDGVGQLTSINGNGLT
jgi:hypothetical protein